MPITEMMMRMVEQEEMERLQRFAKARAAYDGQMPDPLPKTKADPDGQDNVKLNFSRLIVDIGVDFLFGVGVEFGKEKEKKERLSAAEEGASPEPSEEDEWLDEAWKFNKKELILSDIGINGGICGHTFVRLVKPSKDTKGFPRLICLDPSTVTPFHELDDYDDVFAWKIQWNTVDFRAKQPRVAVRRQMIIRNEQKTAWEIIDEVATGMASHTAHNRWFFHSTPAGKWEHLSSEVWPYSWSPIFHAKNLPAPNCFWGTSDLEKDIVDTNHAVNSVLSKMNRIIRNHAHPQPVGKGFGGQEIVWGEGGIVILPTKESEIDYLEMKGDLMPTLDFYERLKDAYHEMSRVPRIATGKVDGIGALSGVALKLLYGPFTAKTRTKQTLYGDMLSEICMRMLEIAEKGKDVPIERKFGDTTPTDTKEEAETSEILDRLGVSKDTLIERMGFDPETERTKKQAEMEVQDERDVERMKAEAEIGDSLLGAFDKGKKKPGGQ